MLSQVVPSKYRKYRLVPIGILLKWLALFSMASRHRKGVMVMLRKIFFLFLLSLLILSACRSLKQSEPVFPIKEYERMLVGRLDTNYVGTKNCLYACHYHDKLKRDFDASTMGVQLSKRSGLPLVDCESCHGAGSLAIEGITPEKVKMDAKAGKQTACNFETLLDIKRLPAQAKSLICLKCHTGNATFNLHNWRTGTHAINDVSCSDCHKIHDGPDLIVRQNDMEEMCTKCHQDINVMFSLPSHHPVPEKRIFCTDCHDQHGTFNDHLLKAPTTKEMCTSCHADKEGPYVFEHAEMTEECMTCHSPHGSINNNLLVMKVPYLCLQCHAGHRTSTAAALESKGAYYTRCTDCHSQIHGTDIPSATGKGTFTH